MKMLFLFWTCVASLWMATSAFGFGVKALFEYDFKKYPQGFVYLRSESQIVDGQVASEKILVNDKDYDVFAFYLDLGAGLNSS